MKPQILLVLITASAVVTTPVVANDSSDISLGALSTQGISVADPNEIHIRQQPEFELNLGTAGRKHYVLNPEILDENLLAFRDLSNATQVRFLHKRKTFLSRAASVLNRVGVTLSVGSYVNSKIRFKKRGWTDVRSNQKEMIQRLLQSVDNQLWQRAAVVADQNEFFVFANVSFIHERGFLSNGSGGSNGIGIAMGFNTEINGLIFEIIRDSEDFHYALSPFYSIGFVPKAGIGFGSTSSRESETRSGQAAYPPFAPGFASDLNDRFILGVSSSLATLPPLVGDTFSYVNKLKQHIVVRVVISPMLPGFVRVKMGDTQFVKHQIAKWNERIRSGLSCVGLLSSNDDGPGLSSAGFTQWTAPPFEDVQ
jgi:hypothetical protein